MKALAAALCLVATPAAAGMMLVPCDRPLTAMAPIVLHSLPAKRVPHRRHAAGRHGARHLLARGLCPIWIDESGADAVPLEDRFAAAFGQDAPGFDGAPGTDAPSFPDNEGFFPDSAADGELAPFQELAASALAFWGADGSGGEGSGATPIPEPSTWILFLAGLPALAVAAAFKRRRCA